jgi:hypothetical protein
MSGIKLHLTHKSLLALSLRIVQSDVMWRSNEWHWCWREWVPLKHQYSLPDHTVPPLCKTQMSQHLHRSIFSLLVVMLMACYGIEVPMVQNEICPVMSHSNHVNFPAAFMIIHKAELLMSVQTEFSVDSLCTNTVHRIGNLSFAGAKSKDSLCFIPFPQTQFTPQIACMYFNCTCLCWKLFHFPCL